MLNRHRSVPRSLRTSLDLVHCPVVVARPVVGAAQQLIDAHVVFVNRAAREVVRGGGADQVLSQLFADPLGVAVRVTSDAWSAPGTHRGLLGGDGSIEIVAVRHGQLVVLTLFDRAEATMARQRMEESEARFRDIVQHLQVSVTLLDPVLDDRGTLIDAIVRFRNARADADRPGTPLLNRLVSEVYITPWSFLVAAAEAWATGGVVTTSIANDGTERMRSLQPEYLETQLARVGGLLVEISYDRSAEHRHLLALESSEQLYRAIADELTQPIHVYRPVFDDDGEMIDQQVVFANHAAESSRQRAESIVGLCVSQVLADWDTGAALRAARKAWMLEGQPVKVDILVDVDGTVTRPVTLLLRRFGDYLVSFAVRPS